MNPSDLPPKMCQNIEKTLCDLGNLVSGQFPMTHRRVYAGDRPVATYFCLHGPRSVKLTAILDQRQNQIIFYGSDGVRRSSQPFVPAAV